MLGGRGSERVRLSGRWRPDPESRSVVSKGWAKWKGKGPSPGTGKNGTYVRKGVLGARKEAGRGVEAGLCRGRRTMRDQEAGPSQGPAPWQGAQILPILGEAARLTRPQRGMGD